LFTRAEAGECGYSPFQVRRRLTTGEWQQVCGPVLAFRGRQLTVPVLAAAAHLAVPGSVIAGPSAALWYDLPTGTTTRWLWVGPMRRRRIADVRVLRDALSGDDIRRADGMLITGPGRTVFDCLRVLPDDHALAALDRAIQRGWTTFGEQVRRVHAHAGRGGAPRLARLIRVAGGGARSAAERRMVALLRNAGLSGWVANAEIRDGSGLIGYGDIVFARVRLVVEIDGFAYHSDADRFQRDRTRQNRLVGAGWTVLRFTWRDLRDRPGEVIATIRATLRRLTGS
jgi:very-short-patch-repair endonuclease